MGGQRQPVDAVHQLFETQAKANRVDHRQIAEALQVSRQRLAQGQVGGAIETGEAAVGHL